MSKNYSFSVPVRVELPEGALSKEQQEQMTERAKQAAQKSVEEYVQAALSPEKPWWMKTYGEGK